MEKLTLTLWDADQRPIILKTFSGSWLVGDDENGLRAASGSRHGDAGTEWSVARTAKGTLVVYATHCNGDFAPNMRLWTMATQKYY